MSTLHLKPTLSHSPLRCVQENLAPRTWIRVPEGKYTVMDRVTHSEYDLALGNYSVIQVLQDRADMAPLLYAGLDIERQRGGLARGFPNWMAAEDKVSGRAFALGRLNPSHSCLCAPGL